MDRRAYRRSCASHSRSAEHARWRVDSWTVTCPCADVMITGSAWLVTRSRQRAGAECRAPGFVNSQLRSIRVREARGLDSLIRRALRELDAGRKTNLPVP